MKSHSVEAAEQFLQAYTKGRLYMGRAKVLAAAMEPAAGDDDDAYIILLQLNSLQHSKILKNPTMLLLIYCSGLFIEYLTPAWAAK